MCDARAKRRSEHFPLETAEGTNSPRSAANSFISPGASARLAGLTLKIDRTDRMEPASACSFCLLAAGVDSSSVESKQSDIFYRDDRIIAFISAGWWPNNPGSV